MNKFLKVMAMMVAMAGLGGCAQIPLVGSFFFGPPASAYQQNVILLCAQAPTATLSASAKSELARLCATPPTTNPTPAQVDALAIVARAFGGGK